MARTSPGGREEGENRSCPPHPTEGTQNDFGRTFLKLDRLIGCLPPRSHHLPPPDTQTRNISLTRDIIYIVLTVRAQVSAVGQNKEETHHHLEGLSTGTGQEQEVMSHVL